jgi:antitoxin CptB
MDTDNLSKLRWQCRRGTLELDILLENYLSASFSSASNDEKATFTELLTLEDTELLPYLMGDRIPEADALATLVNKIRQLPPTLNL